MCGADMLPYVTPILLQYATVVYLKCSNGTLIRKCAGVGGTIGFEVTGGIAMNAGVQYFTVDSTKYATIATKHYYPPFRYITCINDLI